MPYARRTSQSAVFRAGVLGTLAALSPGASAAQSVTIDFDAPSAPPFFKFVVPGTGLGPHLSYPDASVDGGVILNDSFFGNGATTDPNIFASCDRCQLGDGSSLPGVITVDFAQAVDRVRLDAINGVAVPAVFTLTAFDAQQAVVASSSVGLSAFQTFGFVAPLSVSGPGIISCAVTNDHEPGYTFAIDTLVLTRCAADLDDSGDVGFSDILRIIGAWGPCGAPCPEDLSGNGQVDFADILAAIGAWGPCP